MQKYLKKKIRDERGVYIAVYAKDPEELERKELHPIPGSPPDLLNIENNCPFADRCEHAMKVCKMAMPQAEKFSETHFCSCWLNHPYAQGKGV